MLQTMMKHPAVIVPTKSTPVEKKTNNFLPGEKLYHSEDNPVYFYIQKVLNHTFPGRKSLNFYCPPVSEKLRTTRQKDILEFTSTSEFLD